MNNEEKQPDEIAITADQMMQILLDGQRELEARVTLLESQQIATEAKQAAIETRQKASDEAMQSYFEKLKKQTAPLLEGVASRNGDPLRSSG